MKLTTLYKPRLKEVKAWKIFFKDRDKDKLYGLYYKTESAYTPGKLYISKKGPGFHAYATREGARSYFSKSGCEALKKVVLYNVKGQWGVGHIGYIASRMKILP